MYCWASSEDVYEFKPSIRQDGSKRPPPFDGIPTKSSRGERCLSSKTILITRSTSSQSYPQTLVWVIGKGCGCWIGLWSWSGFSYPILSWPIDNFNSFQGCFMTEVVDFLIFPQFKITSHLPSPPSVTSLSYHCHHLRLIFVVDWCCRSIYPRYSLRWYG